MCILVIRWRSHKHGYKQGLYNGKESDASKLEERIIIQETKRRKLYKWTSVEMKIDRASRKRPPKSIDNTSDSPTCRHYQQKILKYTQNRNAVAFTARPLRRAAAETQALSQRSRVDGTAALGSPSAPPIGFERGCCEEQ